MSGSTVATGFGGAILDYGRKFTENAKQTLGAPDRSFILPAIAAIIAIAIIVMIIYVAVQSGVSKPAKAITGPIDLYNPKSPVILDRGVTKTAMAASYTFSYYVNISSVPDMRATATPFLMLPGVWMLGYNAAQEQLLLTQGTTADSPDWGGFDTVVLPSVPMQRWVQVTMTMEGRTMDFYLNGKLIKSHSFANVPPSSAASIILLPNNLMGQMAYVQVWPRRLTVTEVENNYVDTCDSRGRPYLGPELLKAIKGFKVPNLFCPNGVCGGKNVDAKPSQQWVFPYQ
jgi:hypothetical protein